MLARHVNTQPACLAQQRNQMPSQPHLALRCTAADGLGRVARALRRLPALFRRHCHLDLLLNAAVQDGAQVSGVLKVNPINWLPNQYR